MSRLLLKCNIIVNLHVDDMIRVSVPNWISVSEADENVQVCAKVLSYGTVSGSFTVMYTTRRSSGKKKTNNERRRTINWTTFSSYRRF